MVLREKFREDYFRLHEGVIDDGTGDNGDSDGDEGQGREDDDADGL
jgi:hypothetical protein